VLKRGSAEADQPTRMLRFHHRTAAGGAIVQAPRRAAPASGKAAGGICSMSAVEDLYSCKRLILGRFSSRF
jgi:hypothetical protein